LAIRKRLGATQQDIADYLGLNRSQVGNYEAGIRDLPLRVAKLLSELELWEATASSGDMTLPTPDDMKPSAGTIAMWQRLKRQNAFHLKQSERMLKDAETRFIEAARWLAKLETFPAKNGARRRWAERLKRRHLATMSSHGIAVQSEIRMRIAGYKARIAVLDEYLERAGK
jgi:transcriptional regulator with XRE-family HTH domain